MGKADIAVKNWLSDNERFADLFNGMIFGGRQVIRPEELDTMDRETDIIITDKNGKSRGMQRHRDIAKRWKRQVALAVLACEAQNDINYAMPVRNMTQDGLSYTDQIRIQWKEKEKARKSGRKGNKLTGEEYLSRFGKEDKIFPVITLVFYYDVKKWDAALELYDMFELDIEQKDAELLKKYIPNYRINLIDAGNVEHLERFRTDLQQVFGMLQCRSEKEKLQEYIRKNKDYFESVDVETYQAMRELLRSERIMRDMSSAGKEEKIDMCRAMEEWYADAVREGRAAGNETGHSGRAGRGKSRRKSRRHSRRPSRRHSRRPSRRHSRRHSRRPSKGKSRGKSRGKEGNYPNNAHKRAVPRRDRKLY